MTAIVIGTSGGIGAGLASDTSRNLDRVMLRRIGQAAALPGAWPDMA